MLKSIVSAWLAVRSVFLGLFLFTWSALFGFLVLIFAIWDRRTLRTYGLQVVFARGLLRVCGIPLRVHGAERLPEGPAVFMANHRSHIDPPALIAAFPQRRLRWVAKKELGRIPFFGWGLKAAGHILIDRRNRARAISSLLDARGAIDPGVAIVFFPEGTRSMLPGMLPFKKGGFYLAIQSALPVVPIAVRGSRAILPKHGRILRSGPIDVDVLDPIPTAGLSASNVHDLSDLVRTRIESALAASEGPASGAVRR